ncbi:MAG: protease B [Flammeovirgaceae bacterium]|nr:protease B [Flammeovirgaceae bacterium]MBE61977.1 protease B [Flammeovirgaceae bacterium]MBR06226.1 protease B [Rickettsiales bacterium]HCX21517.1 protease B [Cytophagales bacterium]|tara:strand:+ start:4584 stop:5522 length:939 start_codon:yes stop_codon:yes gene_type:complete
MKKLTYYSALMLISMGFYACETGQSIEEEQISQEVLTKLVDLGFDIENQSPILFDGGYLVEGDIYLTDYDLNHMTKGTRLPVEEQYSTDNLVSTGGSRTITVYIPVDGTSDGGSGGGGKGGGKGNGKNNDAASAKGGKPGGGGGSTSTFSTAYADALDEAIARYNAQNLELSFQRVTTSSADLVFTRLGSRDENSGVLGSAGFPTASGDPYGQIKMSGILESTYGLSVNGIATIMAHEMGHCIGFRHTDYFDRSISCGGSAYNEGDGGVGANHIPGTPTDATLQAQSWMLSCTDGSNRNFNNADKTALDYLY